MQPFVLIRSNEYHDSLEMLLATTILDEKPGIGKCNIGMGTEYSLRLFAQLGFEDPAISAAGPTDVIIAAEAESEGVFRQAVEETFQQLFGRPAAEKEYDTCLTTEDALRNHPEAQVAVISIPGEYAGREAMKALQAGLHVILFSSHIAPEEEKELKEYASAHGLICMGPDCGVVNLNGVAFLLGSITRKGPFGICGASGVGIQHVGALIHQAGSGCSQLIGTGGGDLKPPVNAISMLTGIDALENDPETKYLILVSRKPPQEALTRLLSRISACKKPVVACLMGADRAQVEAAGAIFAPDLDAAAVEALKLAGIACPLQSDAELDAMARDAVQGMAGEQKYLRGLFTGGTYCEEAMNTISRRIGNVYSNAPLREELRLADSLVSVQNTCVDVGEDEFTEGKPHPTMEPGGRRPFILREGENPETCVLLLDFIFAVSAHPDPVGVILDDLKKVMADARARGGRLAVVASICGTDADFQNLQEQRRKLTEAGVYVCSTNRQAADLAARIVALKNGGEQ